MKTMTLAGLFIALLICLPRISVAHSAATSLYQQANQAYQDGNYPEAIELYQKILESGVINGAVYYNLGNAYFKDNHLGHAILFYERAKRLLPRDEDVAANLALASELTVDKITTGRGSLLARFLTWPARTFNIAELTRTSLVLYLATTALAVVAIWTRKAGVRKKVLVGICIVGVSLIVSGASLLGNIYQQRKVSRAIVLAPAADARSGPGQEYTKIFSVHQGTKFRIRQEREGWYLVSLPNGLGGWVPAEIAEII